MRMDGVLSVEPSEGEGASILKRGKVPNIEDIDFEWESQESVSTDKG